MYKINKKTATHPRKWDLWFMDNLKQGISTLAGHFWALYAAKLLSKDNSDECGWFMIQFLVDTFIATILGFILSNISIKLCSFVSNVFAKKWLLIGNYETKPNCKYRIWAFQTLHWLVCSLFAKVACTFLISGMCYYFTIVNHWFSNMWVAERNNELIVVTIIVPTTMNSTQLLIQNWFLRWNKPDNEIVRENVQRLIDVI